MVNDTNKYGSAGEFSDFFLYLLCAWLMTSKLHGWPASVGLAQARPNNNTCNKATVLTNLGPKTCKIVQTVVNYSQKFV